MTKKKVCCLCGKEFKEKGNNPYPVDNKKGHECCDNCAYAIVVPARMRMLLNSAATAAKAEVCVKAKKKRKAK